MTTKIKTAMPMTYNVQHKRGADFHKTIKLKEDDGVTAKNTTGYSSTLTIKSSQNGEVYAVVAATNSPASGQFNYDITAAALAEYEFANAEYEILIVDDSGGRTIPFIGQFMLY